MLKQWLRAIKNRWFGPTVRFPERRLPRRRPLSVEPLEDRTLPAVQFFQPAANEVVINSLLPGNDDDVTLRVVNGVLEAGVNGAGFRRDMDDLLPGDQTLTLNPDSVVNVDVGGTVFIADMSRAAGQFLSIGEMEFVANATVSSRRTPAGADPLAGVSNADSLNMTFRAPEITVHDGARILAHASDGFQGGDVQLIADTGSDLTFDAVTPFFRDLDATATLDVGAALVRARNLTLTTAATTKRFADFDVDSDTLTNQVTANFARLRNPELTELVFADEGNGDTITRSAGDWLQDGFKVGQTISIQGTQHNDGLYVVASLTASTLKLTTSASLDGEVRTGAEVTQTLARIRGTPTLTFTRNNPLFPRPGQDVLGNDTITRSSGSWLADGFETGQLIVIEDAGDNNGEYTIAQVTDTELVLDEGGFLDNVTLAPVGMSGNPQLTFLPLASLSNPSTTGLTFTDNDTAADTITRSSGDWVLDGFAVGQAILVKGSSKNLGPYTITAVTPDTITIRTDGELVDESVAGGVEVVQISGGDTITRSTGSWVADGFKAGHTINVYDSANNNRTFTIQSVSDATLTLEEQNAVTPESGLGVAVFSLEPSITAVYTDLEPAKIPLVARDRFGAIIPTVASTVQDIGNLFKIEAARLELLNNIVGIAQGAITDVESHVTIRSGAVLSATGNVTITSKAVSEISLTSPGLSIPGLSGFTGQLGTPVAVGFGVSRSDATAVVQTGATITAGGNFNLQADSVNTLDLQMKSYSGLIMGTAALQQTPAAVLNKVPGATRSVLSNPVKVPLPAFTMAYGQASSESEASLRPGSEVTVGSPTSPGVAFVTATNTNHFDVGAEGFVLFPRKNMGHGLSVAVSQVDSDAVAAVDGRLTVHGDATVNALALNESNSTISKTVVRNTTPVSPLAEGVGVFVGSVKSVNEKANQGLGADANQVSMAAAVALAVSNNAAIARVGPGALVNVGNNLSVTSEAQDNFRSVAIGASMAKAQLALGGAVNFGTYRNDSRAFVGEAATVNAGGALTVESDAKIPNQVMLDDIALDVVEFFKNLQFDPPIDALPEADSPQELSQRVQEVTAYGATHVADAVSVLLPALNALALAPETGRVVATTYTNASADGKTTDYRGKFAAAGTFNLLLLDNASDAWIGEGASVNQGGPFPANLATQSVSVDASALIETVNIAGLATAISFFSKIGAGGASSDGSSIGTNATLAIYDNTAKAHLDDEARVSAARDVRVNGATRILSIGVAQAGGESQQFGLAVSGALHYFTNETLAYVEDTATVIAGRNIGIEADTGLVGIDFSIAVERGGRISIGANVATNLFDNTTHAFIGSVNDSAVPKGTVQAGGSVVVDAHSDETLVNVALAGAVATGFLPTEPTGSALSDLVNSAGLKDGTVAGALGGGPGSNLPRVETAMIAEVKTGKLDKLTGLGTKIRTAAAPKLDAIAASFGRSPTTGAVQNSQSGFGVAGDAAVNVVFDDTQAFITDGVTVLAGGDVAVLADTESVLVGTTAAFVFSTTLKGGGIAGSFGFSYLDRDTQAFTEGVTIQAGSDLRVEAESTDKHITVTAGGGGAGVGTLGVVGSLNVHTVLNDTVAAVGPGTVVTDARNIVVRADNLVQVLSVAGTATIAGTVGIGASGDVVLIANNADAHIDGADVVARGDVSVLANSQEDVLAVAASLALSTKNLGVSGSAAMQVIFTDTTATVTDSTVTAGGDVTVDANDDTRILAIAGGGAIASQNAFGASFGGTFVFRDVEASIAGGSTVGATGQVTVDATADETVFKFTASGTLSGTLAVAGSMQALIDLSDVVAHVSDASVTAGDVVIHAQHDSDFLTAAGSLGLSTGTAGAGLAGDLHGIDKTVQAYVATDATVTATDDVTVEAANEERMITVAASFAAGNSGAGAGSLAYTGLVTTTEVSLDGTVTAGGDVVVAADGEAKVLPFAGTASFSSNVGVGMSVAGILHLDETEATVGDNARVTAGTVTLSAKSTEDVLSAAVSGSITGGVAVTGSFPINLLFETTRAAVGEGAHVTAQNGGVELLAADRTNVISSAGSVAVGTGSVAVGVSADLLALVKTTEAEIESQAVVDAAGDVKVQARSDEEVRSVVVSGTVGGEVGVGGAAGVSTVVTTTLATVGEGARITAGGDVIVSADGDAYFEMKAGQLGGGVSVGFGGSATLLVHTDTVEARIGLDATVSGDDVSVTAVSEEELIGIALAGQGGQFASVAMSATFGALVENTRAIIDDGAVVNATGTVEVHAEDVTIIRGGAGVASISISVEGGVGLGAGADVGVMVKTTAAEIDDDAVVNAGENVLVTAASKQDIISVAGTAGIAAGITVGVAGSLGLHTVLADTLARVGRRAKVRGDGSVVVEAEDETDALFVDGNVGVGIGGAGASLGAFVVDKDTEAIIDGAAEVTAKAEKPGVAALNGTIDVSYNSYLNSIRDSIPAIGDILPDDLDLSDGDDLSAADLIDRSLFDDRVTTPARQTVRGVSVGAVDTTDVIKLVLGAAGGGGGIQLSGALNVITTDTRAHVADGATVTSGTDASGGEGEIRVAAGADFGSVTLAGSLAIGSGVGAGFDLTILNGDVSATTGAARLTAKDDVRIEAHQTEDVLALVASGTFQGQFGVAGAASGVVIDNETTASLGNDVTIRAGTVRVAASDDTDVDILAGSLVLSDGAGASLGVVPITKRTLATVGQRANVETTGAATVAANSTEDFLTLTIAGTVGGSYVGLAGAVSVAVLDSDTQASVGELAEFKTGQSLTVTADNRVKVVAIDGTLSYSGAAAAAGAVDVGIVKNDTTAFIANGAAIDASHDVIVHAEASKKAVSITVSAGAAATFGVGGAASAWSLSGNLDGDARGSISANDSSGDSTGQYADDNLAAASVDSLLTGYPTDDVNGPANDDPNYGEKVGAAVADARQKVQQSRPSNRITSVVEATDVPSGTSAFLGDEVSVTAGGTVEVTAEEEVKLLQVAGGVGLGLSPLTGGVGVGASVVVSLVDGNVDAHVGASSVVNANLLFVEATFNEDLNGIGLAGGVGGLVGLGAQVVIQKDSTDVAASVRDGTTVTAGEVVVMAETQREMDALAIGGAGSLLVAAGVAVARAEAGGSTSATLGEGVTVGQTNVTTISATDETDVNSQSYALAVGVGLAGQGNNAAVTIDPTVTASIGNGSNVTSQVVSILATTQQNANAEAFGVSFAGAFAMGASVAQAEVSPTTTAAIGDNVHLLGSPFGNLALLARHNTDFNGNATGGMANAEAKASGGGLLVGLNGAFAGADASANVSSRTGKNAVMDGGNLTVRALADNRAVSDSFGISGGTASVGVMLAESDASGSTQTLIGEGSQLTARPFLATLGGTLNIEARSTDLTEADTQAAAGGLLAAGTGSSADASTDVTVTAEVGRNARLTAQSLNISVSSTTDADAESRAITVAVGLAVGVSMADASVDADVTAAVGDGAVLKSTSDLNIKAAHNTGLDTDPTFAGLDRGADARAEADGGSLIGIGGAFADASNTANVRTTVGRNASLTAGGEADLKARGSTWARALGDGDVFGVIGVGGVFADSEVSGETSVSVGDGTAISAANIVLDARDYTDAYTIAEAATGGLLVAVSGADADASNTHTVTANVGRNANLTSGSGVAVVAQSRGIVFARADGLTGGAVAVGGSFADASQDATVTAQLGDGTKVATPGDVAVRANFATASGGKVADAQARGSAGALIGVTGSEADAEATLDVKAGLGNNTVVAAGGNVNVESRSVSDLNSEANNRIDGLFALGRAAADGTLDETTAAAIGNGAAVSGRNVFVTSDARRFSLVRATGRGDGLITAFGAEANNHIIYATTADVGDQARLTATDFLLVRATSDSVGDLRAKVGEENEDIGLASSAQAGASGVIAGKDIGADFRPLYHPGDGSRGPVAALSDAEVFQTYQAPTAVSVGAGAALQGRNVFLDARIERAQMGHINGQFQYGPGDDALAVVDVRSAIGLTNATANVAVVVSANVTVGEDASFRGDDQVQLSAVTSGVASYSSTDSDPDGIVDIGPISIGAGEAGAYATNAQFVRSTIGVAGGSEIVTNHLQVNGVVNPVIWDTRAEGFDDNNNNDEDENRRGRADVDVDFNGHVTLLRDKPSLVVNADGTVSGRGIDFVLLRDGQPVAQLHGDPELTFSDVDNSPDQIRRSTGSWTGPTMTGAPLLDFDDEFIDLGLRGVVTRSAGSWLDDGFQAGQTIRIEGSEGQDGVYVIRSLTATRLVLETPLPGAIVFNAANVSVRAAGSVQGRTEIRPTGAPILRFTPRGGGDTIQRLDGGNWIADGFRAGQEVRIANGGNGDGVYHLASVTADTLRLVESFTLPSGIFNSADVAAIAAGDTLIVVGSPNNDGAYEVVSTTGNTLTLATNGELTEESVAGATLYRALTGFEGTADFRPLGSSRFIELDLPEGVFVAPFEEGQLILVRGTAGNDGLYRVLDVNEERLTVEPLDGTLVFEFNSAVSISAVEQIQGFGMLDFLAPDVDADTITRDDVGFGGSWIDDGFAVGQTIRVAGTGSNNGEYRIVAVTDETLTLDGTELLVNEVGEASITEAFDTVQVNGVRNDRGSGEAAFNVVGIIIPHYEADNPDFDDQVRRHDINLIIHENGDDLDWYNQGTRLRGSAHFDYQTTYDTVEIVNHSDIDLVINDLTIPNGGFGVPDDVLNLTERAARTPHTIDHGVGTRGNYIALPGKSVSYSPPDRNPDGSFVQISNAVYTDSYVNNQMSVTAGTLAPAATRLLVRNDGASDVLLAGVIQNETGSVSVVNTGGDVVRIVPQQAILTHRTELSAVGSLGTAARHLVVRGGAVGGVNGSLRASAAGDVFIDLSNTDPTSPTFDLGVIQAGGDVVLDLLDPFALGNPIYAYNVAGISAGGDLIVTTRRSDMTLLGGLAAGGSLRLDLPGGKLLDANTTGTDLQATTAILNINAGVGTTTNPLETDVGTLTATVAGGGVFLTNDGDLNVAGILAGMGNVDLSVGGDLHFSAALSTTGNVKLDAAGTVTQDAGFTAVVANDLNLTADAVGSGTQALEINATSLAVDTHTIGGDVFLREGDTVILPTGKLLDAGEGGLHLTGGEFVVNGSVKSATTLSAGVLSGKGTLEGSLTVLGGTVSPGSGPGILRAGSTTFAPGTTLHVEVNGPRLTPIAQHDQLQVNGDVNLGGHPVTGVGGVTLTGSLAAPANHRDTFTILTATGTVSGMVAQSQVFLSGVEFSVVARPSAVDLVVNQAPVVTPLTRTLLEDGSLTFASADFDATDPDGDAILGLRIFSLPTHGTLTFEGSAVTVGQMLTPAQLAGLIYTPEADYFGPDGFTWQAYDGIGYGTGTVTLDVLPVNDAPSFMAGPDTHLSEDAGPQTFAGWATNPSAGPANEANQTLTYEVVGNTNPALFNVAPTVAADGTLTFTPAANASGVAVITVRLRDDGGTDNGGQDHVEHQLTITIDPVADLPTLNLGRVTIDGVEGAHLLNLSASLADTDGSETLSVRIEGLPATARLSAGQRQADSSWVVSGDQLAGLTLFTDDGSYTLSITATATEADGSAATTAAQSIQVTTVNVAPTLTLAGPGQFDPQEPFVLTLTPSDPGVDTIQKWIVHWGDGTVQEVPGNVMSVSHTYALQQGNYLITATATDEDGTWITNGLTVRAAFASPNAAFVAQTYLALVGSPIDAGRFAAWVAELNAAGTHGPAAERARAAVARKIRLSREYLSLLVRRLYLRLLGRAPTDAELARGISVLSQPQRLAKGFPSGNLLAQLLLSREYRIKNGGTRRSWLRAMARDVVGGRLPAELSSGLLSVREVVRRLLKSPTAPLNTVVEAHTFFLGEPPDAAMLKLFRTDLRRGQTAEEVIVNRVLGSAAFFAKQQG